MIEARTAARPYAQAAFKLAQERGELAQWSEMLTLVSAVGENEAMMNLVFDPRIERAQIVAAFEDIGQGYLTPEAVNFIRLLVDNRRVALLPEIQKLYEELRAGAEDRVDATAVSAYELSADQAKKIEQALKRKLGRAVTLNTAVDKSIGGGIVIRAGDLVIDGSVKGRLQELAGQLAH